MKDLMSKTVSGFMTKEVISVHENDSIKKVFKLMDEHGILGLPVLNDEGAVIGIVTETDLINHFTTLKTPRGINILGSIIYLENIADFNEHLKDHCAETVKDIMTEDVATIMHDKTLSDAIDLMGEKNVSRLPVVGEKGELVGIVTRKDIVHEIAKLKSI